MGFSRYCLLAAATVLLGAFVNQSDASLMSDKISKIFPDAKVKLDIKAEFGNDGEMLKAMARKAVNEIDIFAAYHTKSGPIGEVIEILTDGFERTITSEAVALETAIDLFDNILGRDITDKEAALNAINNRINDVRKQFYHGGIIFHSSLGAVKSIVNITDKGDFKFAIDKVQETGTGLFDDLEVAQFFAIQGMKAETDEVKKKCLKAAHSAIISAAEMAYLNMVTGAKSIIKYFSSSDEATIMQHEPTEKLISHAAKAAAAADSDTIAAMEALNKEFDLAIDMGISVPILKELKTGLVEYIEFSAWSVAICYDAIAQAKLKADTDQKAAVRVIEDAFELAKSILIEGSIKAYESIGSVGRVSGQLDNFHDAIEIAEMSRIEGTKGFDSTKTAAIRAILSGANAADHALDAAHKMLEANEAVIFEDLHEVREKLFYLLKTKA